MNSMGDSAIKQTGNIWHFCIDYSAEKKRIPLICISFVVTVSHNTAGARLFCVF